MSHRLLSWHASYDRLAGEVERKKVTVVPSPNHSGTWFVLDFLASHVAVSDRIELPVALARNALGDNSLLHFHVAGAPPLWEAYDRLLATGRVIIPMRDPLLSLCTRNARHPFLDHRYIVDAWVRIAGNHDGAFFLPVDTVDPDRRRSLLTQVLDRAGLAPAPGLVDHWVEHWPVRNTSGDSNEKRLYADRNWKVLRIRLSEFDYLLQNRDVLRPFLQNYYADLPWWSL